MQETLFDHDRRGQPQHLGGAHHRQVVDRAGDRQSADVATGEEDGVDDVGVGGENQPAVADPQGRAVVEGGEADVVRPAVEKSRRQRLLDQHPHGAATGAVLQGDPLVLRATAWPGARLHSSGCPPYWCQILQVPSLLTIQAPTGFSGSHSLPNRSQSVGVASPDMIAPQMHCSLSADGE